MPKNPPATTFADAVGRATGSSTASAEMEALIGTIPSEVRAHFKIWLEVRSESDRGAAILAAAYLDARLKDAIKTRFYRKGGTAADLLKPSGFLGQYAAKCPDRVLSWFLWEDNLGELKHHW
jgi:hypothetical protein